MILINFRLLRRGRAILAKFSFFFVAPPFCAPFVWVRSVLKSGAPLRMAHLAIEKYKEIGLEIRARRARISIPSLVIASGIHMQRYRN